MPVGQIDGINETGFSYEAVSYNNGDTAVSCDVSIGGALSSGDSKFHPASSKDAAAATCITGLSIPIDLRLTDAGFWRFETLKRGARVTYHQPGNPIDGLVYTFGSIDCEAGALNDELEWSPIEL